MQINCHLSFQLTLVLTTIFDVTNQQDTTLNWTEIVGNEKLGVFYENTQRLYFELFERRAYKRELSPIYSLQPYNLTAQEVPRFNVNITLAYVKVIELAAQSQEIDQLFEFGFEWTDPRLQWNPDDFGGVSKIWLQMDSIWLPENSISNA
ncbi:unnamed protein product, partial [Mesorhabditis belari]|uniref:Neurotransmitter-gated ion-channel ligand-binding domain-containing protein n=1 Tax=Mesorhabditis belari TaxID=2138241 RepID=A0AAF3J7V7_9BILA